MQLPPPFLVLSSEGRFKENYFPKSMQEVTAVSRPWTLKNNNKRDFYEKYQLSKKYNLQIA